MIFLRFLTADRVETPLTW